MKELDQLPIFAVICNAVSVFLKAFSALWGTPVLLVSPVCGCFSFLSFWQAMVIRVAWSGCMSSAWLCCRLGVVASRGMLRGTPDSMSTSSCAGLASFPVLDKGTSPHLRCTFRRGLGSSAFTYELGNVCLGLDQAGKAAGVSIVCLLIQYTVHVEHSPRQAVFCRVRFLLRRTRSISVLGPGTQAG